MHVLVSSTFSASRLAADGGDGDDGAAATRGGSPWLAVVGAAAPPRTELLRAFGTCARASRAPVQRARARHCTTCIEALKPALQNGGQRLQGFNAESSIYNSPIVSAKLRICQVQGGNSGVRTGTTYRTSTGTVPVRYGTGTGTGMVQRKCEFYISASFADVT